MKLIADMAALDRRAIEEYGIPGFLLMEEAGRQVAAIVANVRQKTTNGGLIAILCGPGNNGGDGLCCARKLVSLFGDCGGQAPPVIALLTQSADAYRADAAEQLRLLKAFEIPLLEAPPLETLEAVLNDASVVVDALFGGGLNRPIEGREADWIAALAKRQAQARPVAVIAIDFPSGVTAKAGAILNSAVRADVTVALGAAKPGHYLPPGKFHRGELMITPIGLPPRLLSEDASPFWLTNPVMAQAALPKLAPDAHKYSRGSVLIVGGSAQTPGAAHLAARAAMISGAGMVTLAMPQSAMSGLTLEAELLRAPLPQTPQGDLAQTASDVLLETFEARRCRAIAIGPGLGLTPGATTLLLKTIQALAPRQTPVILDADALTLLAQNDEPPALGPHVFLTPHIGECARLLRCDVKAILADLPAAARTLQAKTGAHVLLKASVMIGAGPDGLIWLNETGTPALATAGSGDSLTGLLAGLLAQGALPALAAPCASWLHGASAEAAVQTRGARCVRAGDLIASLPAAFQRLESALTQRDTR
ncbi:MAG: NAD(P)H-hydrate dehydratase [Vampirovibrionales bacterium]|nr:NAD(P)H-hydrate dehydratase [Vampirovibrionales bacterium]